MLSLFIIYFSVEKKNHNNIKLIGILHQYTSIRKRHKIQNVWLWELHTTTWICFSDETKNELHFSWRMLRIFIQGKILEINEPHIHIYITNGLQFGVKEKAKKKKRKRRQTNRCWHFVDFQSFIQWQHTQTIKYKEKRATERGRWPNM